MDLFQSDNHGRNEVRFLTPSPNQLALAQTAFAAYSGELVDPASILVIEGANINSANFRVGSKYLKCLRAKSECPIPLAPLSENLLARGVPVARFLPDRSGQIPTEFLHLEQHYFAFVQSFDSGNFHTGTYEGIRDFLSLWPAMRVALADFTPVATQYDPYDKPIPTFAELLGQSREVGNLVDEYLAENESLLKATEEKVASKGYASGQGLHHFDLHPHNFLCSGDRIKLLLDLESFRWMPENLSLSFGLFKLGRKGVSAKAISLENFHHLIFQDEKTPPEEMIFWTHSELLRRIKLILRLYFESNNSAWIGDLPKHTAGLLEAKKLFRPS
jgi:hypothetical protein